jgi:hypothetical protein
MRTRLHTSSLIAAVVAAVVGSGFGRTVHAATTPVPTLSAVVSGPGLMYPDPAIGVVPTAAQVDSFPYLTEEFFVSGTASGAPYTTRIIIRRPKDVKAFSGTVVAEALHAGGRSLIFEWSRV